MTTDIFAYYDCSLGAPEIQPAWVPLWERSWRARGWNPRLITARHARRSKFYSSLKSDPILLPFLALHAVGGGWLTPLSTINFSFPPIRVRSALVIKYPSDLFQASRAALDRSFRGRGLRFKVSSVGVGLKSFPSPEEALKFDF